MGDPRLGFGTQKWPRPRPCPALIELEASHKWQRSLGCGDTEQGTLPPLGVSPEGFMGKGHWSWVLQGESGPERQTK